jgi:monoamine oxidase
VLTGWVGGPAAERLARLDHDAIFDQALETLGRAFGLGRGQLEGLLAARHLHNWWADPFTRGAYSYVAAGGLPAQRALARPVADTLFFAGEAAETTGHFSTVHGAIATGRRAAHEVLESL